jgi:hypothetical protein
MNWKPPRKDRRKDGYRCLGWLPHLDGWHVVIWDATEQNEWYLENDAGVDPKIFLPLPPPPEQNKDRTATSEPQPELGLRDE